MKNAKIGKKIAISFGAILLCMVVMTSSIFITGQMAGSNLRTIEELISFQMGTAGFLEEFSNARVAATILYESDNWDEYRKAVDAYAAATVVLEELERSATGSSVLSVFAGDLRQIAESTREWMDVVDDLEESNETLTELRALFYTLIEDATVLAEEIIYLKQLENLENDIRGGVVNQLALLQRRNRVIAAAEIIIELQRVQIACEPVIYDFDISAADDAKGQIAVLVAAVVKFTNDSPADEQQHGRDVQDALMQYVYAFDQYVDTVVWHNEAASSTVTRAAEAVDDINTILREIEKVIVDRVSAAEQSNMTALIIAIGISLLSIAGGVFFALVLVNNISKPLIPITAFMQQVSTTGDLTLRPEDAENMRRIGKRRDEIGQLSSAASAFVGHVVEVSQVLEVMADGDLTHDMKRQSEKDTMGNSLHHLFENLNRIFGEINASTVQVNDGSKQLADGAQTLAQGTTQQAAAVQQLSASVSEVAGKTRENADMAGKAASLAGTIKVNAEKGSRQMNEMTAAVKEINNASRSIGNVIKVIDDIAFQTNILALNAAVEAARAGQHGKGFAVVAEEVRALAAKSAAAAKDTGSLIANSIEKAALGARIADETSASLSEIVEGINESAQIVSDIARSSEEQTRSITQINSGIDQVAGVVQQNSATAQESAAASEEMNSQSRILDELVGQFKLKGSSRLRPAISRPSAPKLEALEIPEMLTYAVDDDGFGKY
jgi:methyl-accepting chemotaxis protein